MMRFALEFAAMLLMAVMVLIALTASPGWAENEMASQQ